MAGFLLENYMNEMNTNILKVSYPTVFKERFYFECRDGWVNLIKDIAQYIVSRTDKCYATQVKEKFGTLRFYISCVDEEGNSSMDEQTFREIQDYIISVERRSAYICEMCGVKLDSVNKHKSNSYYIENICVSCDAMRTHEEEMAMIKRALKSREQ